MNWTEEQLKAILTRNTSIIVSAGAGSGKTAVLSERVIEHLKRGIHIDELLILTFTNAAAKEMKERIEKKIRKTPSLKEELKRLDTAYITTFDAFCLSLVKKYHYKKNISSNLNIVSESFINLKKQELLDEILEEYYQKKEPNFVKLITDFTAKDDNNIRDAILKILQNIELKIKKKEYLKNYIDNFYNEEFYQLIKEDYQKYTNELLNGIEEILEEIKRIDDSGYYEKLDIALSPIKEKKYELFVKFPTANKETKEEVKVLRDEIKKIVKTLLEVANLDIEKHIENYQKTKDNISVLLKIIEVLDEKLTSFKERHDLYTFTDIELIACSLLDETDILNELKGKLKEIMIDEYQDTSDIQEYFISKLENNNVYMVGDIKQSIYRFRNANPNIFKDKYDHYKKNNGGIKIDLNRNFRSRIEVIESINDVFSSIMNLDYGGADYQLDHQLIFGNKVYEENKREAKTEILTYENKKKKEEIEASIIASDILSRIEKKEQVYDFEQNTLRNITYHDFAILLDRLSYTDTYLKIFEKYQIPLDVVKDNSILENTLLHIITNIVSLITNTSKEKNDFYYTSIARSFLFCMNDNDILESLENHFKDTIIHVKVTQIRNKLNELSSYEFLKEIVKTFEIEENLYKIGNIKENEKIIDYLYELALSLEDLGYTPYDLNTYLEKILNSNLDLKLTKEEENTNAVKIMTIHKSKGLEFPICYFAGLTKKFNISDMKEEFLIDSKYGIITPFYEEGKCETILKPLCKNNYIKEEISEKIRLFYVALTRAKEKMIFVLPKIEDEITLSEYEKSKYRSFYDILKSILTKIEPYIKEGTILEKKVQNIEHKNEIVPFTVKNIQVKHHQEEKITFSKKIQKELTKEEKQNIEYGLKMHEKLETIDFKKKDEYKDPIILNLFSSGLIKDLKGATIYQEYEFIKEEEGTLKNGIIDLMIEYETEIDIIDYKLKNIEDEAYQKQLNGYKTYIQEKTNKKVNIYLYSIMEGSIKKL